MLALLGGHGTEESAKAQIDDAVAAGKPLQLLITNYTKEGTPFANKIAISPPVDPPYKYT
jgi:hypothetical protein